MAWSSLDAKNTINAGRIDLIYWDGRRQLQQQPQQMQMHNHEGVSWSFSICISKQANLKSPVNVLHILQFTMQKICVSKFQTINKIAT